MPDITLTVDFTQVNSLNTTLKSTDTIFVKVVDSLLRESKRADRVTKAFADTTQKNLDIINKAEAIVTAKLQQESDRREKLRVKEAARAEKEAQKLVDANNKIIASEIKRRAEEDKKAATYAQNFQAQVGPNLGLGAQGISAGASASAFGDEAERLRLKYDKIYASSQLYEKSLAEINRAHMLGVTSVKQHESAVESLNQEYQNFQNGIRQVGNRFVQHSNQTSDGMSRMGVAAQQTGYQFSDFIVQVQGGTNPLVAFSQQMTQMAGLLYLLPPAVQAARVSFVLFSISMTTAFAAVTILIPLLAGLAMAFANSGKESDKTAKNIDTQTQAYDNLLSKLADLRLARQMEASGIATEEEQKVQNVINALLEKRTALQEKINNLKAIGGRTAGYTEQQEAELDLLQTEIDKNEQLLKTFSYLQQVEAAERRRANEQRNIYRQQKLDADAQAKTQLVATENQTNADRARAQERLAAEQTYQAAIDKTIAKNQYWADQAKAAERQAVAVDYIVKNLQLLGAKKDAEGFNKAMEDALAAGVKFSLVDLSSIVALAARNGWDLAGALQAAYAAATQKAPAAASVLMGGGGRPEVNLNEMQYRGAVIKGRVAINQKVVADAAASNQGGAGPAEATQTAIEKLQEQLAVERELIGTSEAYQKVRQALGEEFKITSPQVIAGLVEQATQVERLIDLEKQREQVLGTVKSSMEDTLMSIVDGTKSARDAFKAMAADIIKELYRVYVVQQLVNSVSGFFTPSKGHSPSMAPPRAPGRAAGGSMMANMAYMVGENGPELVIPRHSGTVVNAKQTANTMNGGGSITVQNNITVTGSDAAMVRTEVAKMIPQITNATKAAVLDAKQRGGQFAAAFR